MASHKKSVFLTDQLYNLAAGLLYAASISCFVSTADFAPGGVSGLALIINHLCGLPVGLTVLALNLPLMAVCRRYLGRRFLGRSAVSMLYCTFFQDVVFAHLPGYHGEAILSALFAGLLWGAGVALLYMRGSSSGGADFLTMSIKTLYPHLSVGAITGCIDVAVILLGWPVFGSLDAVLYGLITTAVTSAVIDRMMYGSRSGKQVLIVTNHGQAVAERIAAQCGRGSTLLDATGTYTGERRQLVLCACSRQEAYRIRTIACRVEQHCIVMISDASEVYGEGFLSF